ncbi:hypothetical protein BaRGS_00018141 [Batillaria attramentaria]|uniref:Uncharacterized protein n=1 Tax=Batillaria attramentaria TaxID=370345 RepID=A0ABD0KTI4_9CAEN
MGKLTLRGPPRARKGDKHSSLSSNAPRNYEGPRRQHCAADVFVRTVFNRANQPLIRADLSLAVSPLFCWCPGTDGHCGASWDTSSPHSSASNCPSAHLSIFSLPLQNTTTLATPQGLTRSKHQFRQLPPSCPTSIFSNGSKWASTSLTPSSREGKQLTDASRIRQRFTDRIRLWAAAASCVRVDVCMCEGCPTSPVTGAAKWKPRKLTTEMHKRRL